MFRQLARIGLQLVVAVVIVGGALSTLTGCDEELYAEAYGYETTGYSDDWASDTVETHLSNYVDYGYGVPWSTDLY